MRVTSQTATRFRLRRQQVSYPVILQSMLKSIMYFVIHVHFYVYRHTDTLVQGLSEGGEGGGGEEGEI